MRKGRHGECEVEGRKEKYTRAFRKIPAIPGFLNFVLFLFIKSKNAKRKQS